MRTIAVILSVVILFISAMPCEDEKPHDDTTHTELSSKHDHDDLCPTICVCSCCGTTITFESQAEYDFILKDKISTHLITTYQSNYRFDFGAKIWQPPRA